MKNSVNIAYIGLGRRGYGVFDACLTEMSDVQITAICDLDIAKMEI